MNLFVRSRRLVVAATVAVTTAVPAFADDAPAAPQVDATFSPQVLTTQAQHAEILRKVQSVEWSKSLFEAMKAKTDVWADKVQEDPEYATSRLAMNWDTHYTTAVTKGSRTIGGEGKAPIPTPRFAGARDWKTDYGRQPLDRPDAVQRSGRQDLPDPP